MSELKTQIHKEFDERFQEVEFLSGVPVSLPKKTSIEIKSFIDQSIDQAVAEERDRIMNAIVKNVDMTDEQLQDILGLLTNN